MLLVALGGCSAPQPPRPDAPSDSTRTEIYRRAYDEFAEASFFKPAESGHTYVPAFTFAPLILQEIAVTGPDGRSSKGGQVPAGSRRAFSDEASFTVYYRHDQVFIYDLPHDQFTYLWRPTEEMPAQTNHALPIQGIRITLDSTGQPVMWEVLADTSGTEVVFVSQSLEAAAAAEFGKPLPGRRFSIERGMREAPKTVVARVIDDGPVPMGPILYLRRGTGDICMVMCRCMPPQAKRLVKEGYYALTGLDDAGAGPQLAGIGASSKIHLAFWPGEPPDRNRLEQCLRLPRNF